MPAFHFSHPLSSWYLQFYKWICSIDWAKEPDRCEGVMKGGYVRLRSHARLLHATTLCRFINCTLASMFSPCPITPPSLFRRSLLADS